MICDETEHFGQRSFISCKCTVLFNNVRLQSTMYMYIVAMSLYSIIIYFLVLQSIGRKGGESDMRMDAPTPEAH